MRPREPLTLFNGSGLKQPSPSCSLGSRERQPPKHWDRAKEPRAIAGLWGAWLQVIQDQLPRGREASLFPQQQLSCCSSIKADPKGSEQEGLRPGLQDAPPGPPWPRPASSGFGSAPKPSPEERERKQSSHTIAIHYTLVSTFIPRT